MPNFFAEIPVVQMMATEEDDDGYNEYDSETSSGGKFEKRLKVASFC